METSATVYRKNHISGIKAIHWLTLIICCILLLVSLSFTIKAWASISARSETRYSCEELSYQPVLLNQESCSASITIHDEYINRIEIPLASGTAGMETLRVQILDGDNCIFSEDVLATGMVINDCIILNVQHAGLVKGHTYSLIFTGNQTSSATIMVAENNLVSNAQYFRFTDGTLYKCVLILLNVMLLAAIIFCIICRAEIHTVFLVMALLIGIILVFATPALSVPDEYRHFVRAYELTEGHFIATTYSEKDAYWIGSNPYALCDFPAELTSLKLISVSSSKTYAGEIVLYPFLEKWKDLFSDSWSGETIETMYMATSTISPLAYIPQVIGIFLAKCSPIPVLVFYGARIAELIVCTLIIYFAIRKTPYFKNLFFIIAMLPDVLFARSSCSTDGFLIALILLFLAFVLEIKSRENSSFRSVDWMKFILLSILIGSIKFPYMLVVLLLLMIDEKIIRTPASVFLSNVIAVAVIAGIGLMVHTITQQLLGMYTPEGHPSTNIPYLLAHPVSVLNLVAQTLIENHESYILDCFGTFGVLYFAYCIVVMQYDTCPLLNTKDRVICLIVYMGFLVGLTFGGYFMNVPLITYIWGIQSRYFIPALPALFIMGSGIAQKPASKMCRSDLNGLTKIIVIGCAVISVLVNFIRSYC